MSPQLVLHVLPPSHPCMTATAALNLKGLDYERVELVPAPVLYPSEEVREAERWGDEELQDLGRRMSWGALHFRPEAMGTFAGGAPLDGPGTDFAIRFVRGAWKYHKITAGGTPAHAAPAGGTPAA